ncbi:MAG: glucose-6-phosphate dehydrogenase [bacterium]|nr:glucose-6-phosphate dehydrogenase [bacterium]MDZ4248059.1 glucose-6-phosphate dehydrogenase [Patescibacteria group bacterium]
MAKTKTERQAERHPAQATHAEITEPTTLVLFGATGGLSAKYLLPALGHLAKNGLLGPSFRLVGVSQQSHTDDEFRKWIGSAATNALPGTAEELVRTARISHLSADLSAPGWEKALAKKIGARSCRTVYYLATPPSLFDPVVEGLARARLNRRAGGGTPAIVLEKPFGRDLRSARHLNRHLARHFDESQVFRMDHYLGKDTVQNILAFRFENGLFEPVWNREHIDHVQITVAEDEGMSSRGRYYEEAGALRDVVQSHALQLLAQIAMEPASSWAAKDVRARRVEALRGLKPLAPQQIGTRVISGQYAAGEDMLGRPTAGYRDERFVPTGSKVETFVALAAELPNRRWKGVPFYIRTGKRMPKRVAEITVQFKPSRHRRREHGGGANLLTLRVQPNEGIALRLFLKRPGEAPESLEEVDMSFCYRDAFAGKLPSAYDRLLLDALCGNQGLFTRADEVEAAWRFVDPILRHWQRHDVRPRRYAAGRWGPAAADRLLEADGRRWWSDRLDVCPVPGAGQAVTHPDG